MVVLHMVGGAENHGKTSSTLLNFVSRGVATFWPRHTPHMYTWSQELKTFSKMFQH